MVNLTHIRCHFGRETAPGTASPAEASLTLTDLTGTAVAYSQDATMPAASFYDVGDTWTDATPTFTPVTADLKILETDAERRQLPPSQLRRPE